MALATNAVTTFTTKGQREDLSDKIYMVAPIRTPFMSNAARGQATGVFHEWQTDDLASAVTNNQQLEGDVVSGAVQSSTSTVRLGNYCEIAYKSFGVTGTTEAVSKAGRKREAGRLMTNKTLELKRDMETSVLYNKAANAGGATTARVAGGMGAFIKTNVNKDAGGSNPTYTDKPSAARTDSATTRAFTETIAKDVIQQCYSSGAEISTIMLGAVNKQTASGFAGIATKTYQQTAAEAAAIIGAADIYVSDFGVLRIVPNLFQRARDAWFIDWKMISVDYLQPFKTIPLAKRGDVDETQLLAEYTLKVANEKGCGLAADLA